MAISVVGQASAAATSVAFPAHAVGDMLLVFARGTVAAPTVPTAGGTVPAWVTLQTGLANSIGLTVCSFVATAATTTTGTWTNATHICVLVLRPGAGKLIQTSAARSSVGNGNNTQTIVYPALTLAVTDGTSMGVRVGTRTVAITAVGTAPTSWTAQSIQPAGASALMSTHTRAALVANPAADTVTTTSSNAAYRAVTVEVLEVGAQSVTVGGTSSSQTFGTVGIGKGPVTLTLGNLGSAQAFGAIIAVGGPVSVQAGGVYPPGYTPTIVGRFVVGDGHRVGGTIGQFGSVTAQITTGTNVPVAGVSSAASLGTPTFKAVFVRTVGAVASAQSFGSLAFRVTLGSGGVLTAQAFGTVTPKAAITRTVTGITSAQSFGALVVSLAGGTTPVADFAGSPVSGFSPLTVTFTDLSTIPSAGPSSTTLVSYTPGTDRNDFTGAVGVRLGIGASNLTFDWWGARSNGVGGTRTVKVYEWFSGVVQHTFTIDYTGKAAGEYAWTKTAPFTLLANGYYAVLMDVVAYDGNTWKNPGPVSYQPVFVNVYDSYYSGGLATGISNSSFIGLDFGAT